MYNIFKKIFIQETIVEKNFFTYYYDTIMNVIENVIENVKEIEYQYNIIEKCFFIVKIDNLINKFTLMESLMLIDSLICGILFLKYVFIFQIKLNEDMVKKYNSIYILSCLERYSLYFCIYIIYMYCCNKYIYTILLLITIPPIQNGFFRIKCINNSLKQYLHNKQIFIKYSIAKITVHFIHQLHPQIDTISNYHIFIIYNNLNTRFLLNIIKNTLFILLLNILRNFTSTYYYYKAIKFAYMHSTGYLYNIIPLDNAIYLANLIIKEKRWNEFEKIEIINGFFVLIVNKYNLLNNINLPLNITCQIYLFQICSLWAFVSLLKMITRLQIISNIVICVFLISTYIYLSKCTIKNILTSVLIYYLIIFNTNDLIITLVIISNKFIYYWIEEFFFFIQNITNIKKVIKAYNKVDLSE
jgi:hypothetical protein